MKHRHRHINTGKNLKNELVECNHVCRCRVGAPGMEMCSATEAIKPFRQFTGSCIQTINILPLQDCICRRLEKQGRQDGRSDQPQPTVSLSHLLGGKTEMNVEVHSLLKTTGNTILVLMKKHHH